jgi:hypothetical protein
MQGSRPPCRARNEAPRGLWARGSIPAGNLKPSTWRVRPGRANLRKGSQTVESWYKGGAVGSAASLGAPAPKSLDLIVTIGRGGEEWAWGYQGARPPLWLARRAVAVVARPMHLMEVYGRVSADHASCIGALPCGV